MSDSSLSWDYLPDMCRHCKATSARCVGCPFNPVKFEVKEKE